MLIQNHKRNKMRHPTEKAEWVSHFIIMGEGMAMGPEIYCAISTY